MKKLISMRMSAIYMVLFLGLSSILFSGCSKEASADEASKIQIDDVVDIPEDGIITKEMFEAFADTDRTVSFKGTNGEVSYQWEFCGKNIHNPVDMNLSVDFIRDDIELNEIKKLSGNAPYAIGIKFAAEEMVTAPRLKIKLPEKWKADTAVLCIEQDGEAMKVSDVSISEEDGYTVLSADIAEADKTLYIAAGLSSKSDESQALGLEDGKDAEDIENETSHEKSMDDSILKSDEGGNSTSISSNESMDSSSKAPSSNSSTNGSRTCTISISCSSILNNMESLKDGKAEFVPSDGWILRPVQVEIEDGESVFNVLLAVCKKNRIHMEHEYFPVYESEYIEGINQLYERDCGAMSGWTYKVNGWFPNYGCDKYKLSGGENISWEYKCN